MDRARDHQKMTYFLLMPYLKDYYDKEEPLTLKEKTRFNQNLIIVKIDREEIKVKIQEAGELGDLKENAEYHAAKENKVTSRENIATSAFFQIVKQLKSILKTLTISSLVQLLLFLTQIKKQVKNIKLSHEESNKSEGKFPTKSLAKALLGKEEGDTVVVHAPKGEIEYEVEKVEYK